MYISEFWCGVASTIIIEFLAIIIYGFGRSFGGEDNETTKKTDEGTERSDRGGNAESR